MYYKQSLKTDSSITGFIPAIACLVTGALIWIFIGPLQAFLAVATFFVLYAVFSLWIYIRVHNISYLSASLWQFLFGLFIYTRPRYQLLFAVDQRVSALVAICLLASTVWLLYLVFTRKAKWKGRELFELASLEIRVDPSGFTTRPMPAGKAEYSREELEGFANYLSKNLIAIPFREGNKIFLVPVKGGEEFRFLFNPARFREKKTWIAFDFDGNVTVNISRQDYLDFKEELSFDQLCENLGKLLTDFMNYYRKGEAERIVYRLNELKLNIAS